jgi:hypothetical protein
MCRFNGQQPVDLVMWVKLGFFGSPLNSIQIAKLNGITHILNGVANTTTLLHE